MSKYVLMLLPPELVKHFDTAEASEVMLSSAEKALHFL